MARILDEADDHVPNRDVLQVLARTIDRALNGRPGRRDLGFVLAVFPYRAPPDTPANYVASCERQGGAEVLESLAHRLREE